MLFEVAPDDIENLGDVDLRTLVARLCEEESRLHGFSPAAVTWGGNQNAADGGIDVRVSLDNGAVIKGYVPRAATGFQVKAQDMARQAILNEMAPGGTLRQSIAELAAKGGAYIIASSQGSVSDTALTDRKQAMLDAVEGKVPANSLRVEFYDRTRLATWVNQHPGLVPWVREKIGRPLSGWRPFADWSSSPAPLDAPYLLDEGVRLVGPTEQGRDGLSASDGVNALRRILEKPSGIVRLVGLSGVGKTRLVQALFDSRIGTDPLAQVEAVYTDISESPNPVPLELASRLLQLRQRAILIVDNCGPDLHQRLAARIKEADGLLSLITVEYDINDDEPENTNVFKLDVTSVDLMEKILENRFPDLAAPSRRVVAEFSGGNARVAFALAATAKSGESLANLRNRDLFERLFHQSKDRDNNLLAAAKACALLYSFDGETTTGSQSELEILGSLVGLSADALFAHVAALHRRQLVQKRGKWRAILPHAIANRLAKLALEDIPFEKIEAAIMHSGSERIIRSFSKRMGYLHDDERARALAKKWFADGGFLEPIGHYNELGIACFTNIAPVDPEETLLFIERASARLPWFFGEQNRNRSVIVRVLRSIAYDAALFDRAMDVMKRFAIDEADGPQDSAESVFKSMFALYLSGTHASAAQRAKVIRTLFSSNNEAETSLGLESLRQMLEYGSFTSHYSFEFGARSRDYGWMPRIGKDITEWFGHALKVAEEIGLQDGPLPAQVRKAVANRFSELCGRAGMMDELISLAEKYSQKSPWLDGWIALRITIKRYKDKMPPADLQALEDLSSRLQPNDLESMVRAYALSKEWTTLDIAESEEEDEDDMMAARERVLDLCIDLGRQLTQQPAKLDALLPEIFAVGSTKVAGLGRGMASACTSLRDSWTYLVTKYLEVPESDRSASVLGGFAEEAMRRDAKECELILDSALTDPRLHSQFLYLKACAGLTPEGVDRLLTALDQPTIPTGTFQILQSGRLHEGMTDAQLAVFLRKLSARDDGVPVAVEILGMRVFGAKSEKRPVSDAVKESGRELIPKIAFESKGHGHEFMLARVVEASIRPEDYELACAVCTQISEGLQAHKISPWDVDDVIKSLVKSCPRAVLDVLVENVGSMRLYSLFAEIRETRPDPLGDLSLNTLIDWAQEKPEVRFSALARVVRFSDANEDSASRTWSPAAERIISLAPNPAEVLEIFIERFEPTSWGGSRAEIMASRIPLIQALAAHERSEVSQWSQNALPTFGATVERERRSEAARDKERDERFE